MPCTICGFVVLFHHILQGQEANPGSPEVVLVVALVERWTHDRKVSGSTPGQGAIKSTRSTQPSIPPG